MDTPIRSDGAGDAHETPHPVPVTFRREDYRHIPGWGSDLGRSRRPAEPMERTPPRLALNQQIVPAQQAQNVEILQSNERPTMTPVFGTTQPPHGLSGAVRRFAFRYSENDLRHWLLLLGADRVDMVEGVASDLASGRIPNLYAEMGLAAEVRHNPTGAARRALTVVAIGALAFLWMTRRRRR